MRAALLLFAGLACSSPSWASIITQYNCTASAYGGNQAPVVTVTQSGVPSCHAQQTAVSPNSVATVNAFLLTPPAVGVGASNEIIGGLNMSTYTERGGFNLAICGLNEILCDAYASMDALQTITFDTGGASRMGWAKIFPQAKAYTTGDGPFGANASLNGENLLLALSSFFLPVQLGGGGSLASSVHVSSEYDQAGTFLLSYQAFIFEADGTTPVAVTDANPEPSSFALMGLGLAMLAGRRLRS